MQTFDSPKLPPLHHDTRIANVAVCYCALQPVHCHWQAIWVRRFCVRAKIFPGEVWIGNEREQLHALIDRYESKIRRRLHGKLSAARHVYDLDDLMSSLHRRIDAAWLMGRARFADMEMAARYIHSVARRVAMEAIRREKRQHRRRSALAVMQSAAAAEPDTLQSDASLLTRALALLGEDDRAMLSLWVRGLDHRAVAEHMNLGFEAYRSRWRRCRQQLRRSAGHAA